MIADHRSLGASRDPHAEGTDLGRRVHDLVVPMIADAASLAVIDPFGGVVAVEGCGDIDLDREEVARLLDDVFAEGDVQVDPADDTAGAARAAVALRVRDEIHGVLVAEARGGRRIRGPETDCLARVADCAAVALDGAQLFGTLRAVEDRFELLMHQAPIGVALIERDAHGIPRYVEVNAALSAVAGRDGGALVGSVAGSMAHPDDRSAVAAFLEGAFEAGAGTRSHQARFIDGGGAERHVALTATPMRGASVLLQLQDLTEWRASERAMLRLATQDHLTGLRNRAAFEALAERALAEATRFGEPGALLVVDIDAFKHLNETQGTATGDRALRLVAATLERRIRRTDVLARLGDDEFAVLMIRTAAGDARAVAGALTAELSGLTLPGVTGPIPLSVSGGLRTFGPDLPETLCGLLGEAELGVCEARATNRGGFAEIAADDARVQRHRTHNRWSQRIRAALATNGFVLYEQPIVSATDGALSHGELLIRMRGPDGTVIGPGEFLPAAVRDGQIRAIDAWVVAEAVRVLEARHAAGVTTGAAINLAGDGLCDPALIDRIVETLRHVTFPPERLIVEITETAAIADLERAREQAERLTAAGCRLALDDFGAGFSSFTFLKYLPVDIIKIDGQFIRQLPSNRCDAATVRAIVDVARVLGVGVVAEFVETEAALELLRELGVGYVQGHLIGRAEPLADMSRS